MFTSPNQFLFWVIICLLVGLLIPGTVSGECWALEVAEEEGQFF